MLNFAHVQDDVNPHVLGMLEGIFSLDAEHNYNPMQMYTQLEYHRMNFLVMSNLPLFSFSL